MQNKGLCITCIQSENCIFSKKQTIWQCEEFSSGNNLAKKFKLANAKKIVPVEVSSESE